MSNTGNRNTGYRNTGDRNTGNRNTGDRNTGNRNTGDRNTGNRNTGDRNTGDWNTGDNNTGDWNTGNWNTGNNNTGYFNIDEPKVRIFWKETDIKKEDIIFPDFCYFNLTKWINELDMTKEEKEADKNEYYKTIWGYLKSYKYKDAFQNSYNKLSEKEKEKQTKQLKKLPNFCPKIFKEISGIDINEKEKIEELTLEEDFKKLWKNIKIIN